MLVRVLYVSKPTHALDREGLEAFIAPIRKSALAFNPTRDLTGALAYSEHCFVQALEGEAEDVYELLERIALNPGHTDFRVIDDRDIRNRAFPDWAMAFAPAPGASVDGLSPRETMRFLIDAAQNCNQVRAIPGHVAAAQSAA